MRFQFLYLIQIRKDRNKKFIESNLKGRSTCFLVETLITKVLETIKPYSGLTPNLELDPELDPNPKG